MGRPRSFDRDQAVTIAMRLFWERGFEATTVSDLTVAIGITPPSLYAAFGDKRGLFAEAVTKYQSEPDAFSTRALDEPTARGAVARLLHDAALEYTKSDQPRGCMILAEPLLGEHRERSRAKLVARLRAGIDAGELPSSTSDAGLADYITAVLSGMSARARDGADSAELLGIAETAMHAWPTPE